MIELTQKEGIVLENLARNSAISQRDLAKRTGLSLGLINVILKRFIKVGYIQVSRLNKRKVNYLLTPQGLLITVRKTYRYANETIRSFYSIQRKLSTLLKGLTDSGYRYFSIEGEGEIRDLLEAELHRSDRRDLITLGQEHQAAQDAVVLNVTDRPFNGEFSGKVIDIHKQLEVLP